MTTAAFTGGTHAITARLLAFALVAALLAPSLAPLAGADLLAWTPDHGHAALGAVGEHTHAWDGIATHDHATHDHGAATPAEGDPAADEGADKGADVVFTPGDLAGGAALPIVITGALTPARSIERAVSLPVALEPLQASVSPEAPPPR